MGHKWSHEWQNKRNSGERKELFGVVFIYGGFVGFGLLVEVELLEGTLLFVPVEGVHHGNGTWGVN